MRSKMHDLWGRPRHWLQRMSRAPKEKCEIRRRQAESPPQQGRQETEMVQLGGRRLVAKPLEIQEPNTELFEVLGATTTTTGGLGQR